MPLLTIAIPTYNRKEILFENISILIPQIEDGVEILIIDNASDYDALTLIERFKSNKNYSKIRLVKNGTNIGGNANILRCLELSYGEYVWLLGDDDYPKATAVNSILRGLTMGDVVWINYYSNNQFHYKRLDSLESADICDFLYSLTSINDLVFMSNNVYKTALIKLGLDCAYENINMMAPHMIAMVAGLECKPTRGKYIASNECLFDSLSNNKDKSTSWSQYKLFLGVMSVYQLKFSNSIIKAFIYLLKGARGNWLADKYMIAAFWQLSDELGVRRSFIISRVFLMHSLVIDKLRFPITLFNYLFAISTGAVFWKRKEIVKSLYKKWWGHA